MGTYKLVLLLTVAFLATPLSTPGQVGSRRVAVVQKQRPRTDTGEKRSIQSVRGQDTRPQHRNLLQVQQSDFVILPAEDQVSVQFQVNEVGLYSAEVHFRCEDSTRTHDRLGMSVESGARRGALKGQDGDFHSWFGRTRTLDPDTSYRLYFWLDDAMLQQIGADRTLRFVLGRLDRTRSREEGEFESRHRVTITLPRIAGRVHLRVPRPIVVSADTNGVATPHALTINPMEMIQYRVNLTFPRSGPRESTRVFSAEFHVPLSRGRRNADIGGVLLQAGRWTTARDVRSSGNYDFLATPATDFSKDVNGIRTIPSQQAWDRFKREGFFVRLDERATVIVNGLFYLSGGKVPADYYVAELEEVRLSSVPEEGDGAFWLRLNSLATLGGRARAARGEDPFGERTPASDYLVQNRLFSIPIPPAGDSQGVVHPHLPLFVLPVSSLQRKETLAISTDPHYFHDMPPLEQAEYIMSETGGYKFFEGLFSQDLKKLAEGIATFLIAASTAKSPDQYRSFGVDAFETDRSRGWAMSDTGDRFRIEGRASRDAVYREVYGTRGQSVATTSALAPGARGGTSHTSVLRVRRVPGVFVDGATVNITSLKTSRNFDGYLKVYIGIAGHEGGRVKTSEQGLNMESSAIGSSWSYWINSIAERGPYTLRSGVAHEIDFHTIDFDNPERNPQGLWEQLHNAYGPWAALHISVALDTERGKNTRAADIGYITIYPYDYLFGDLRGSSRRDGDWVIIRGTMPVHGYILDEIGIEVRLRVQARND
jgi:hypothetical protein